MIEQAIEKGYIYDGETDSFTLYLNDLHRWLRERYTIVVLINHAPFNQKYSYRISGKYQDGKEGVLKAYNFQSYATYEEALHAGLIEGLNFITDGN